MIGELRRDAATLVTIVACTDKSHNQGPNVTLCPLSNLELKPFSPRQLPPVHHPTAVTDRLPPPPGPRALTVDLIHLRWFVLEPGPLAAFSSLLASGTGSHQASCWSEAEGGWPWAFGAMAIDALNLERGSLDAAERLTPGIAGIPRGFQTGHLSPTWHVPHHGGTASGWPMATSSAYQRSTC